MMQSGIDLAAFRKAKELSQAELADAVGVSQATISRLEKGDYEPSLQLLVKIARALDLDLRDLLAKEALSAILGQDEQANFYAFCPNPLCDRNETALKGDVPTVLWKSGQFYLADKYESINFCTRCGTALARECPSCGRRLEQQGTVFCISCGTKITNRPTEEEWSRIREIHGVIEDDDIPF